MPAYYRISIEGQLGASPEVFSTGFAASATGTAPTQVQMNTWADAVMSLLAAGNDGGTWIRGQLGSASFIQRVRIYYYPDVGAPAGLMANSSAAPIAGSGAHTHPPQLATVVSLMTGLPGGRNRGRMYIPLLTGTVGSTLKRDGLSTSTAVNFAGFLNAAVGTASAGLADEPAVVSVAGGAVTPVTQVRIGDVVDTQRRRRDALIEVYVTASV